MRFLPLARAAALAFVVVVGFLATGCAGTQPHAGVGPDPIPKVFAYLTADSLDTLQALYLGQIETDTRAAWAACLGADPVPCRVAAVTNGQATTEATRRRFKAAIAAQHVAAREADALASCATAHCLNEHRGVLLASIGEIRTIVQAVRADVCRGDGARRCAAPDASPLLAALAAPEARP